jgi:hypothetical protein
VRARESAMMWIAWLSWRSPPRCSRWRVVLPELAGIGGGAGVTREASVGGESFGARGVPMMIAAVTGPASAAG